MGCSATGATFYAIYYIVYIAYLEICPNNSFQFHALHVNMYYQINKSVFYTLCRCKSLLKYFLLDTRQDPIAPVQAHRTAVLNFPQCEKKKTAQYSYLINLNQSCCSNKIEKPCHSLLLTAFYFIFQSNLFRATYSAEGCSHLPALSSSHRTPVHIS